MLFKQIRLRLSDFVFYEIYSRCNLIKGVRKPVECDCNCYVCKVLKMVSRVENFNQLQGAQS